MAFETLRQAVGRTAPQKRHPTAGSARDPDEVLQPASLDDSEVPSWSERARQRLGTVVIGSFLLLVVLGIVLIFARRYFVAVLTHPVVVTTAKYGTVAAVFYTLGEHRRHQRLMHIDRFVNFSGEGLTRYFGEYETDSAGEDVFVPYRGFSPVLKRPRKLRLGDLGGDLARSATKGNRDEDDPVRIRLDDAVTDAKQTDLGTVVGSLSDGLKHDTWGETTDLYTAPPDLADEDRYRRLQQKLRYYAERVVPHLRDEVETLEEQLADVQERASRDQDEAIDEFIDRYTDIEDARDDRRTVDDDERAVDLGGPTPDTQANGHTGGETQ